MAKKDDDLIGDMKASGGKGKAADKKVAGKKAAAKTPAKAGKKAPAPAAKGKKAAAASNRAERGEGKFYFPADSKERIALRAAIAKIKEPISTKDFAEKVKTETWKVRLAAKDLVAEKQLKMKKEGSALVMSRK